MDLTHVELLWVEGRWGFVPRGASPLRLLLTASSINGVNLLFVKPLVKVTYKPKSGSRVLHVILDVVLNVRPVLTALWPFWVLSVSPGT